MSRAVERVRGGIIVACFPMLITVVVNDAGSAKALDSDARKGGRMAKTVAKVFGVIVAAA